MAIKISRLAASTLVVGISLVFAFPSMAQQKSRDPLMPSADKLRPWDKKVEEFYRKGSSQDDVDKATKELYGDQLQKFGFPANKPVQPYKPVQPATAAPTLPPAVSPLDRNGDGSISRQEYFQAREPLMLPSDRVSGRGRRVMNRLDSQFRNADRNHDGIVTPQELQESGDSRF